MALALDDYSDKRVFIGLSGGINSMAVLCHLATEYPQELKPKHLFLFYAHIRQHSQGTLAFVRAGVKYAREHFDSVTFGCSRADVLAFFGEQKIIPHPMLSPCTEHLKLIPMMQFQLEHETEIDLVGYIRDEVRRIRRQAKKGVTGKGYPIQHFTDAYCFDLVEREIGFYPPIYKILDAEGNRVFKHNNCLPCKNMQGHLWADGTATRDYANVKTHFPLHFEEARQLTGSIGSYWGRKSDTTGCSDVCEF